MPATRLYCCLRLLAEMETHKRRPPQGRQRERKMKTQIIIKEIYTSPSAWEPRYQVFCRDNTGETLLGSHSDLKGAQEHQREMARLLAKKNEG